MTLELVKHDTRILALDLAIGTVGWAIMLRIDEPKPARILPVVAAGHFDLPDKSNPRENRATTSMKRARELGARVLDLVHKHEFKWIFYEYPDKPRSRFAGGTHAGGGPLQEFRVMQGLGLAEGLLVGLAGELAAMHGVQLVAISTTEAKRAILGRDSGSKLQVRHAMESQFGWDLSRLTDDESDAVAVGVAGFRYLEDVVAASPARLKLLKRVRS